MRKIAGATLGVLLAGGAVFVGSKQFSSVGPAVVAAGRPCDVTITSPAPDKGSGRGVLSRHNTESLTVSLVGNARRCPSATVTIFVKEGAGAETTYDTATTSSTGAWSKDVIVTDAVSTRIRAAMASGPSAVLTVNANTGLPLMAIGAPVADSAGVLRVVAPAVATGCGGAGNSHVYLGEPGWLGDTSCATGGQVVTSVVVTGATGGTFTISYDGVELSSSSVSSSPQTFTPTLTLPDHTRADLVLTATNGTGSTVVTYPTRVMTAIPSSIVGADGGSYVLRLTDARAADVEVDYVLPFVDTAVESASIEIQWTTRMIAYVDSCDSANAWLPSTAYTASTSSVKNAGNLYTADTTGTSASSGSGPTGTGANITDGTTRWDYKAPCQAFSTKLYDGGGFDPAGDAGGVLDLGVFLLGSPGGSSASAFPNEGVPGTNKGLVYRHPDVCVLYDPSVTPQVWECKDGTAHDAGTVHTARLSGLPPLNRYYVWVLQKF